MEQKICLFFHKVSLKVMSWTCCLVARINCMAPVFPGQDVGRSEPNIQIYLRKLHWHEERETVNEHCVVHHI